MLVLLIVVPKASVTTRRSSLAMGTLRRLHAAPQPAVRAAATPRAELAGRQQQRGGVCRRSCSRTGGRLSRPIAFRQRAMSETSCRETCLGVAVATAGGTTVGVPVVVPDVER